KACPTGSAADPTTGECVAYGSSGAASYRVDVRTWAQTNYGKDGGLGAPGFCGAFAKKPWMFGVSEGQSAMISIKLELSFPGDEVGSGVVRTTSAFENAYGRTVPKSGADGVAKSAEEVLARLRSGGGSADPKELALTVRCPVVNAARPAAIPAVGGF
ncbi:MAG: hypothetical protein FJ096_03145, partial [Deltaproteobacteria bacterium]|nr:hypothetical protein [Deltaproteobacteria bacterium]